MAVLTRLTAAAILLGLASTAATTAYAGIVQTAPDHTVYRPSPECRIVLPVNPPIVRQCPPHMRGFRPHA